MTQCSLFLALFWVSSITCLVIASPLDHWHSHQDDLTCLTFGDDTFVGFTSKGAVAVFDGTNWIRKFSGYTNRINRIVYGRDRFVAAGQNGTILLASDPAQWERADSGTTVSLRDIEFFQNQFFAVGEEGTILSSNNGVEWRRMDTGITNSLTCLTYGNGAFLAVGSEGIAITSRDRATWTVRATGLDQTLTQASYGTGLFVVLADNRFLTSPDGVSWTIWPIEPPMSSVAATDLVYANDQFVALSYLFHVYSTDGTNWVQASRINTGTTWGSLAYGKGIYVAVGFPGIVQISENGRSWTNRNVIKVSGDDVVYAAERFVTSQGYFSTDGVMWSQGTGLRTSQASVIHAQDRFVTVGRFGEGGSSADSKLWTSFSVGQTTDLLDVDFGNEKYVVLGRGGQIFTSSNLVEWQVSEAVTNINRKVAFLNGAFIGVGSGIWRSVDGISWTNMAILPSAITGIAYQQGKYVACSVLGNVYVSTNLIDWPERPVPDAGSLRDVVSAAGMFIAYGNKDNLIVSQSGDEWREVKLPSSVTRVVFGRNRLLAVGDSVIHSDPIETVALRIERNDSIALLLESASEVEYHLEFADRLAPESNWQIVTNLTRTSNRFEIPAIEFGSTPQKFYRIREITE